MEMQCRRWYKDKCFLPLLRLVPAAILLGLFFAWPRHALLSVRFDLFIAIISTVTFWDLLALILGRGKLTILSLELILFIETILIAASLYGVVEYVKFCMHWRRVETSFHWFLMNHLDLVTIVLWVATTIMTLIFFYQYIRAYPEHWRLRRDRRGIKPLIAFSETGDPMAVLPSFPRHGDTTIERLSIDSLQQPHEDEWEVQSRYGAS
ncbi:hypothetical protein HD806DRAFT_208898 [Xylariaceae sp. AK1471]|nr:hypothetical protein HD806DRAFT_208898 [Xylariaceae sp. AK1471]